MKKAAIIILAGLPLMAAAQTLNVKSKGVTYSFPAQETGVMEYKEGKTLEVMGATFSLNEIEKVYVTEESVENSLVRVEYSDKGAEIFISYDILPYVSASVAGAHVEIDQSGEVSDATSGEITYRLSGTSTDGSLLLNGSYKCSVELTGLTLTNPSGAAIDIENGKRIAVRVAEGTVNALEDGVSGSQKACLYAKGHLEFKQKGILNIKGNKSHAIACKEYVEIKNTTLNITGAVKDGINCAQYFLMESGKLMIASVGDDGVQTDFKDSENREDEDTATITISGGTLDIAVTADAAKAMKAEGNFLFSGGTLTASTSGNGIWDSEKLKTKASACVGADGSIVISGGELYLTSSGSGGKGISADESFESTGGKVTILTSGGLLAYVNGSLNHNYTGNTDRISSDYKSSPKGIKADGDIDINGGVFDITCKGHGGEGIESKAVLTFARGNVKVRAYDDGVNSGSDLIISGGELNIMSTGNGDGIDSNADIHITGGRFQTYGTGGAEQGLDTEDNLYITGGEFLSIGGGNATPRSSESTQAYIALTQSVKAGDVVSVEKDGKEIISFTVDEDYGTSGGTRAPGGGGFPGGGGMGPGFLISCPQLESGATYNVKIGASSYSAQATV